MNAAKILRAVRASTKYAKRHRWEAGVMLGKEFQGSNSGFKPGSVDGYTRPATPDSAAERWEGEFCSWEQAVTRAAVGDVLDFYVYSIDRFGGELVTNVDVLILSPTEAAVQELREKTYTVKI